MTASITGPCADRLRRVRAGCEDSAAGAVTGVGWRRREPTARAVTEPRNDRAAETASAGRNPAVTLAGAPRLPLAANTAATAATPNTPPNRCSVLTTPDAFPISAGGTAASAAVGAAGTAIEMPTPAMTSGGPAGRTRCRRP